MSVFSRLGSVWLDPILGGLFFPQCALCGVSVQGAALCVACAQFRPLAPPWCARCGNPTPESVSRCGACLSGESSGLDGLRSGYWFDERARGLLHQVKYAGRFELLGRFRETVRSSGPVSGVELPAEVIGVPLHSGRWLRRSFNQSDILAGWVAQGMKCRFGVGELRRVRATPTQTGLSRSARRRNVRASFRWFSSRPAPPRVLLVDDVCTTGATLVACARALKKAGTREVFAWTLFRTPRRRFSESIVKGAFRSSISHP